MASCMETDDLFRTCDMEELADTMADQKWQWKYLPCQKKLRLRPEDEISVDSIISGLIDFVIPEQADYVKCDWDIDPKDMLNDKQALLFEEKLYISELNGTSCKLDEENKIFQAHELEPIGEYHLRIEESYDGYVVISNSFMKKNQASSKNCGHSLSGKYDSKFVLIAEKREEFDYVDQTRVEKTLNARTKGDNLIAIRETKLGNDVQRFKAIINIKGRDDVLVLDGGIMLLMRYLVVNKYVGDFPYYSMTLFGKIVRCLLSISKERKNIRVFYRTYKSAVFVKNTQYFNDVEEEVSETFYQGDGRIILHYWKGFNYVLHSTIKPRKIKERHFPKLELLWRQDDVLLKKYELDKKLNFENASEFLHKRPEIADFIQDFVTAAIKYKPANGLDLAIRFFQNMKSRK